jgi:chromosome segregation ATPase
LAVEPVYLGISQVLALRKRYRAGDDVQAEIAHVRDRAAKVFDALDTHRSGAIDLEEFVNGLDRLTASDGDASLVEWLQKEREEAFRGMDFDNSGQVTFEEFLGFVIEKTAPKATIPPAVAAATAEHVRNLEVQKTSLEAANASLRREQQDSAAARIRLEQKISKLAPMADDAIATAERVRNLEVENAALEAANASLQREQQDSAAARIRLEQKVGKLTTDLMKANGHLRELETALQERTASTQLLERDLEALRYSAETASSHSEDARALGFQLSEEKAKLVAARAEAELVGRRMSETQAALADANGRLKLQEKALQELESENRAHEWKETAALRLSMAEDAAHARGQLDDFSLQLHEAKLQLLEEKARTAEAQRDLEEVSARFQALMREKELELLKTNDRNREHERAIAAALDTQRPTDSREIATLRMHLAAQQQVFDTQAEQATEQAKALNLQLVEEKTRVAAASESNAALARRVDQLAADLEASRRLVQSREETIRVLDAAGRESRVIEGAALERQGALLQLEAELREAKRYVDQLHREKDDLAATLRQALRAETAKQLLAYEPDSEALRTKAAYKQYFREKFQQVSPYHAQPAIGWRGSGEYLAAQPRPVMTKAKNAIEGPTASRSCLDMWE